MAQPPVQPPVQQPTLPHPCPDPLHGVTLKMILEQLVEFYGWDEMSRAIRINCFANEPSVSSSLKFLRRTPWARAKIEAMYLWHLRQQGKAQRRPSVRANP